MGIDSELQLGGGEFPKGCTRLSSSGQQALRGRCTPRLQAGSILTSPDAADDDIQGWPGGNKTRRKLYFHCEIVVVLVLVLLYHCCFGVECKMWKMYIKIGEIKILQWRTRALSDGRGSGERKGALLVDYECFSLFQNWQKMSRRRTRKDWKRTSAIEQHAIRQLRCKLQCSAVCVFISGGGSELHSAFLLAK